MNFDNIVSKQDTVHMVRPQPSSHLVVQLYLHIVNDRGNSMTCTVLLQVVDFFGFGLPDVKKEVMSMHHSHDETHRLIPQVGDSMVTNLRRPIFTLLEDTGPGVHDTTVSACDQYLYQQQIGVVRTSYPCVTATCTVMTSERSQHQACMTLCS